MKTQTARRVSILGGGQLSRMLCESASHMGIESRIFADPGATSARRYAGTTTFGKVSDTEILRKFLTESEAVLFENEFVDCDQLERAAAGLPVTFYPALSVIRQLQNKYKQKELCLLAGLPTSPFELLGAAREVPQKLETIREKWGVRDLILKWSRLGYDGKGVFRYDGVQNPAFRKFIENAHHAGSEIYAEKTVDFVRELARVGVRGKDGSVAVYPLVVSEQRNSVCYRVTGPASSLGVSESLEAESERCLVTLAKATEIVGVFAVEFFETRDGSLWINEIAPRVHNSGHYTQDACETSQFENHLRGTLGLPLGSCKSSGVFAMLNLLGPSGSDGKLESMESIPRSPNIFLHGYEKGRVSEGRKMGHLNGRCHSQKELPALLLELEKFEKAWKGGLT